MQSDGNLTDSQDFQLFDPIVFNELSTDPNISHILKTMNEDEVSMNHEKPLKIENVPPSYEESMFYQGGGANFLPNMDVQIPSKEEYAGELGFQVELVLHPQGKHWIYSQTLQKVFINIEQTLPLRFKWTQGILDGLWLRTTMVFSHDQYRNEPVVRCHNHMAVENRNNVKMDHRQLKHVVRCMNPTSIYQENSGHLCVLTPLGVPQTGSDYVPLNFQFFCKNSCNSGMNRRPTELIFTLEDQNCSVLGRRRLLVRVCSCPKRDKEKEESEYDGKVLMKGKKRKITASKKSDKSNDMTVYKLCIDIPGKDNRNEILKFAYNLLAGESLRSGGELQELYKPYMDDYSRKLQL